MAFEIRKKIIEVVGHNGGHLASNLGVVELTIAMHRVFNSPEDAFVWDVSHQSYTHKLLTGRYKDFDTLRLHGGLSGFTKKDESIHDFFDNGHSSTSISSALGLLTARSIQHQSGKVIAVIGDGAMTGGMAFEALCHAGQISKNLIVILNDNQMSISPNNGSFSMYLSRLTMSSPYQRLRQKIDRAVDLIPYINKHLAKLIFRFKRGLKGLLLSNNLFVDLGFEYVGPLNGHDIHGLEVVLRRVKSLPRPVVVHVITKKGKGYSPAENDPVLFHGIGPFCISDGSVEKYDTLSFTEAFSNIMLEMASRNKKIVGITAAMSKGTGLAPFSRHYPARFFDVGIAEEHAVTFAAGLAAGGLLPFVCIYSTFFQRAVDQLIHDVSISNRHVIILLDRAGVVPSDGETHQGLFDISLIRPVPNVVFLAPASAFELYQFLQYAENLKCPVVIRYPKMSCPSELPEFKEKIVEGRGILLLCTDFAPSLVDAETLLNHKVLLVCTGGMFSETLVAARSLLLQHTYTDIYNLRFIKPIDEKYFVSVAKKYDAIVIVEDGVKTSGIAEYLKGVLAEENIFNTEAMAFPDRFLAQGSRYQILEDAFMAPENIECKALGLINALKCNSLKNSM